MNVSISVGGVGVDTGGPVPAGEGVGVDTGVPVLGIPAGEGVGVDTGVPALGIPAGEGRRGFATAPCQCHDQYRNASQNKQSDLTHSPIVLKHVPTLRPFGASNRILGGNFNHKPRSLSMFWPSRDCREHPPDSLSPPPTRPVPVTPSHIDTYFSAY